MLIQNSKIPSIAFKGDYFENPINKEAEEIIKSANLDGATEKELAEFREGLKKIAVNEAGNEHEVMLDVFIPKEKGLESLGLAVIHYNSKKDEETEIEGPNGVKAMLAMKDEIFANLRKAIKGEK